MYDTPNQHHRPDNWKNHQPELPADLPSPIVSIEDRGIRAIIASEVWKRIRPLDCDFLDLEKEERDEWMRTINCCIDLTHKYRPIFGDN